MFSRVKVTADEFRGLSRIWREERLVSLRRSGEGELGSDDGFVHRTTAWTALAQHKTLAIVSALLFGAAGLAAAESINDRYTATALILVEARNVSSADAIPLDANTADGEVEILKSDALAAKVASALDLENDPEFARAEGWLTRLRRAALGPFLQQKKTIPPSPSLGTAAQLPPPSNMNPATRALQRAVVIRRKGLTDVIAVEGASGDGVRAAEIANTYAQVYLREQVGAKLEQLDRAKEALAARLKDYDQQLSRAEAQVGLRELYRETLAKLVEISEKRAVVSPNARLVSPALAPEIPSFPPRGTIVALAAAFGFGLAWAFSFFKALARTSRHPFAKSPPDL